MNAHAPRSAFSRRSLLKGGVLSVGFALVGVPLRAGAQGAARLHDAAQVDSYLEVNADGTVTLYTGKVDLGQGLRIALRQITGEELGIGVDKIKYVEGDTGLTPDQGRTAGSSGIQRGGMQIRQAAATAHKALVDMAAQKLNVPAENLIASDGAVRPKTGGVGLTFAQILGGNKFDLKLDPKAPVKNPGSYTLVGKPLPRPDVPAKCTGENVYIHDFSVPGMLHARVIRPAAVGATLISVDESSIKDFSGVSVVRLKDFLAVAAEDEWTCVRAMRSLKVQWSAGSGLPAQEDLGAALRSSPNARDEAIVSKGTPATLPPGTVRLNASYFWPLQSHASMGPSCAVADVRNGEATVWTASQGTHGNQATYARFLGLPRDKVRLIYLEGSGCYGMNGHEDAGADAAIISRALNRPVRVQWMREDEHGFDPKGPPQLLDIAGAVSAEGDILDWRTEMWLPETTRGMPSIPLLGPAAAGLDTVRGNNAGMTAQNGDPPYAAGAVQVIVHWLKDTPLRPAPLRSPGKPANCFAVESFIDELAAAVGQDPVAFRLRRLSDPRGVEVLKRTAALMSWQGRPSPGAERDAALARGRGISYVHYKHNEAHVGIGMEVLVERASGHIKVERVVCAHDCGQIVNPDGVRAQVEGCIVQTLSRVLMEEVKFDRAGVTSVDWASYPILTFSEVPKIEIDLIDRPSEPPTGAGEAATAPVGAALANAVFDATGVRLRTVPFTPERVKAALGRRST